MAKRAERSTPIHQLVYFRSKKCHYPLMGRQQLGRCTGTVNDTGCFVSSTVRPIILLRRDVSSLAHFGTSLLLRPQDKIFCSKLFVSDKKNFLFLFFFMKLESDSSLKSKISLHLTSNAEWKLLFGSASSVLRRTFKVTRSSGALCRQERTSPVLS